MSLVKAEVGVVFVKSRWITGPRHGGHVDSGGSASSVIKSAGLEQVA